jgi:hypothetical protein
LGGGGPRQKEVTYGTDAAPTALANGIMTRNYQGKPVDVDQVDRNLDSGTYGAQPSMPSNERRTFSYEVEIAGSGTAGTAPAWMELLEGCGMAAASLTALTDAKQTFAAPGTMSSLSHYDFLSDQRRKALGCVGTRWISRPGPIPSSRSTGPALFLPPPPLTRRRPGP